MKSYVCSLIFHVVGLLLFVAASVWTTMNHLWFCAAASFAVVTGICISLYRTQTRQTQMMQRIVDCMNSNDFSQ